MLLFHSEEEYLLLHVGLHQDLLRAQHAAVHQQLFHDLVVGNGEFLPPAKADTGPIKKPIRIQPVGFMISSTVKLPDVKLS